MTFLKQGNHPRKVFVKVEEQRSLSPPEVKVAMFEWLINARRVLKKRLAIKIFQSKWQKVYSDWFKQQPKPIPEKE